MVLLLLSWPLVGEPDRFQRQALPSRFSQCRKSSVRACSPFEASRRSKRPYYVAPLDSKQNVWPSCTAPAPAAGGARGRGRAPRRAPGPRPCGLARVSWRRARGSACLTPGPLSALPPARPGHHR